MTETTTPLPLCVWDDHLICDGCGDEVRVTTDGRRLYAVAAHGDNTGIVEKVDSELIFGCPNFLVKQDEHCNGSVVADLASEHWTAAEKLRTLVAEHGTEVVVR